MEDNLNTAAAEEKQMEHSQSIENTINEPLADNEQIQQEEPNALIEETEVNNTPENQTPVENVEELVAEIPVEEPISESPVIETPVKESVSDLSVEEKAVTELPVEAMKDNNAIISQEDTETVDIEEEIEIADDTYDNLTKEEVIKTLEEVVKEKDVNKIKKQVSLLKIRFLKIVKEERERKLEDNLTAEEEKSEESLQEIAERKVFEDRFNKAFSKYKENKQFFIDSQEQLKLANLEEKKSLLQELKQLIDSNESLKSIYDSFKDIQEKWKAIGPVPQNETTELWQNYHFFVEKFFDKVKISKELKELDLKKNLEQKLALCEKTEALLLETSLFNAFNTLQQYHNEWKEIGAVPDDKKEEIWLRFKDASDRINLKRREHYDNIIKEQENNYQAKLALCNRAQDVTNIDFSSIKQINEVSNETTELLKTWKTIGIAPKQHNEEIWNRFKSILDAFFESKKQYFDKIKGEQLDNYNKKINLCIQAEAVALRNDWRKATEELLKLQKEWKEIGNISKRQSEVLWKRFRKACDTFFAAKDDYFKNVESHEKDNLNLKEALIQKVKETPIADSKEENLDIIKNFQREWTEIGFTPIADKERLWKAFRTAIDQRFDKLNMKEEDIKKIQYQQRIKNILDDDNSSDALRKEKRFLQNKITQIKEDVSLWENNLGFFAHSKNADLLKAEFEKKIVKAKEEIIQLESKLKLLKEVK